MLIVMNLMIAKLFFNIIVNICQVGMESEGFAIYDAMMRMKAEVLYIHHLQFISSILIIWYRLKCSKIFLKMFTVCKEDIVVFKENFYHACNIGVSLCLVW